MWANNSPDTSSAHPYTSGPSLVLGCTVIRTSRAVFVAIVFAATLAFAQDELDLTAPVSAPEKKPAPKPTPKPAAAKPEATTDAELDLSSSADVKHTLLLPVIVRVTQSQGGFSGFDTKKTFDKFDFASHKKFVAALSKQLDGKVVSAEQTQALVVKEGLTIALAHTPAGIAKVAAAANAPTVVLLEFAKTGALVATIYDAEGAQKGEPVLVSNGSLAQKTADELGQSLGAALIALSKEKPAEASAVAATEPLPAPELQPAQVEEDLNDPPPEVTTQKKKGWSPDPDKTRVVAAVGVGGVTRDLSVTGPAASQLAQLKNGTVVGLGVFVQVQPLQFVEALAGSRWSDLEVEVNFRRALVKATGVEGASTGTTCAMSDDDFQVRGSYRVKVVDATYAPQVGVGAGWAQERTIFENCSLPLVSAGYSGVDAQLRVRQPLFRNVLALDAAIGPRFLLSAEGTNTKLSFAGEAWLELKPASVFYVRGGARGSRLSAELQDLSLAETRFFFAVEAGAYF